MRWSQGQWSEERQVKAVNDTGEFNAIPYGPSGTAPDDPREFEKYFDELDKANPGAMKRPDLLIFKARDRDAVDRLVSAAGGLERLPFLSEEGNEIQRLLDLAILAVECENSLWVAKMMPCYGQEPRAQKRLEGKTGFAKNAVLPTVIIKEEDRKRLTEWQRDRGVPIHVWHSFFDVAYGIAFDEFEAMIGAGKVEATKQVYQAPGGATSTKTIYKMPYCYGYELAEGVSEPKLEAASITDKNGHILPYVRFVGGDVKLTEAALRVLTEASS